MYQKVVYEGLDYTSELWLNCYFYNIVMEKLLIFTESSGLGCRIEDSFAGAIAYADDFIVLYQLLFVINN